MSCNSCGKAFGWFTKELGCIKCNRIFCKNCLIYKISSEDKKKTCLRCYSLLNTHPQNVIPQETKDSPIEKLLEVKPDEFTEPVLEPMSSFPVKNIKNRLDLLKDNNIATGNDQNIVDDIQLRLANLKGVDFIPQTSNKIFFSPSNTRTDQEKINDLLNQFNEEIRIDDHGKVVTGSVDDIEKRLAALRGLDMSIIKAKINESEIEETEQDEINRTVLQFLDEAKLPDFLDDPDEQELISSIPPGDKKVLQELPFCEICNEGQSIDYTKFIIYPSLNYINF